MKNPNVAPVQKFSRTKARGQEKETKPARVFADDSFVPAYAMPRTPANLEKDAKQDRFTAVVSDAEKTKN
ncbi:MAG TPA: hypothetical protein VLO30_01745, partial [Chthoniobacterales bacterium]|nr:hypothetical protein [Chthoniobacterales bacterium]